MNFCRMNPRGKASAKAIIRGLAAEGGTDITEGLHLGLDLLEGRQSQNPVSCCLLLTDGRNNGRNFDNTFMLEARRNGNSVYTFGIGDDHDAQYLKAIAG